MASLRCEDCVLTRGKSTILFVIFRLQISLLLVMVSVDLGLDSELF